MPLVMAMLPLVSWMWAVKEIRRAAAMDSWKKAGTETTSEKAAMGLRRVAVRVRRMGVGMERWMGVVRV